MKIAHRILSPEHPVFIIAEIGVNHDGSEERALSLIDAAHAAGADAIKLQVFQSKTLVNGQGVLAEYQKQTTTAESSADLLRRYELTEPQLTRILAYAKSKSLLSIATPFSPSDVPVCTRIGLDAIKIASPDVINIPLLRAAAATSLPMLVSTGAATLDEVATAHKFLDGNCLLMHCVSSYPARDADAHLTFIPQLIARFGALIGYSDHATPLLSGALAVAAGAILLERHLTYDTTASGPDHAASSDPVQFAEYIRLAHLATTLRGTGLKRVLPAEQDVRKVSRQSLVLTQLVPANTRLTPSLLTVQRPGTGISAADYDKALNYRTKLPLPAGTLLTWDHLTPV